MYCTLYGDMSQSPIKFSLCWCMYSTLHHRLAVQGFLIQAPEDNADEFEVTLDGDT